MDDYVKALTIAYFRKDGIGLGFEAAACHK